MNTNTTEMKPLAQRITPGEILVWPSDPCFLYILNGERLNRTTVSVGYGTLDGYFGTPKEERHANAELIKEAFEVAHETGMTPRQLADEKIKLEEKLQTFKEAHADAWARYQDERTAREEFVTRMEQVIPLLDGAFNQDERKAFIPEIEKLLTRENP